MDTRLTFRDYLEFDQDRCGDAACKSLGAMVSKRGETRLGKGNPPGRLPGKSAKEDFSIRTTNRHRWTRRVFSGARVMDCSGTRQISSVTSGKGVPSAMEV